MVARGPQPSGDPPPTAPRAARARVRRIRFQKRLCASGMAAADRGMLEASALIQVFGGGREGGGIDRSSIGRGCCACMGRMGSELGMSAMNSSLCMHMGWAYWHGELTQITGNSVHGCWAPPRWDARNCSRRGSDGCETRAG